MSEQLVPLLMCGKVWLVRICLRSDGQAESCTDKVGVAHFVDALWWLSGSTCVCMWALCCCMYLPHIRRGEPPILLLLHPILFLRTLRAFRFTPGTPVPQVEKLWLRGLSSFSIVPSENLI